jgi:hypothetical protein
VGGSPSPLLNRVYSHINSLNYVKTLAISILKLRPREFAGFFSFCVCKRNELARADPTPQKKDGPLPTAGPRIALLHNRFGERQPSEIRCGSAGSVSFAAVEYCQRRSALLAATQGGELADRQAVSGGVA